MRRLNALVVSPSKITVKVMNWSLMEVRQVETALTMMQHNNIKVVAIHSSFPVSDKNKLKSITAHLTDSVPVIEFSNDTNLKDNIKQAFSAKKRKDLRFTVVDNAFEMELACALKNNN